MVSLSKELKPLNVEELYDHLIKYYIDKKGYTKEKANTIAQKVVEREIARRNG